MTMTAQAQNLAQNLNSEQIVFIMKVMQLLHESTGEQAERLHALIDDIIERKIDFENAQKRIEEL